MLLCLQIYKTFFNPIAYEQDSFIFETKYRYKHLVGGFIVGLPALTPYAALYAAAIAASSLELKDKLRGGRWDWTDWTLTVTGGAIAALIFLVI